LLAAGWLRVRSAHSHARNGCVPRRTAPHCVTSPRAYVTPVRRRVGCGAGGGAGSGAGSAQHTRAERTRHGGVQHQHRQDQRQLAPLQREAAQAQLAPAAACAGLHAWATVRWRCSVRRDSQAAATTSLSCWPLRRGHALARRHCELSVRLPASASPGVLRARSQDREGRAMSSPELRAARTHSNWSGSSRSSGIRPSELSIEAHCLEARAAARGRAADARRAQRRARQAQALDAPRGRPCAAFARRRAALRLRAARRGFRVGPRGRKFWTG
jgi:hypothetical protein